MFTISYFCINLFNTIKIKDDLLTEFYLKVSLSHDSLASCSLINFHVLLSHSAHSFFRFLSLKFLDFHFVFFYTTNNSITLFYRLKPSIIAIFFYDIIKTNSSWLIFESIKALDFKTFMLFNLVFANKAILSSFFFFLNYNF